MTRETETLFYNIRLVVDAMVETEPRTWLISKVNRISPTGICRVTMTQDIFDQHTDFIEKDENGNIIGMWANYFKSNLEPTPVDIDDTLPSSITSVITCSGKPQFKIGGSAKTFTVTYYDENAQKMSDYTVGKWTFKIDDTSIPSELLVLTEMDNTIKVKFLGDDSYIGKIFTVINTSGDVVSSLNIEIIAL